MFRDDGIIYGRLGRSPITRFGMRTLTFGVRALTFALQTLTFRVQMPSSVCERSHSECKRRVRSAIAVFGMQTLKIISLVIRSVNCLYSYRATRC